MTRVTCFRVVPFSRIITQSMWRLSSMIPNNFIAFYQSFVKVDKSRLRCRPSTLNRISRFYTDTGIFASGISTHTILLGSGCSLNAKRLFSSDTILIFKDKKTDDIDIKDIDTNYLLLSKTVLSRYFNVIEIDLYELFATGGMSYLRRTIGNIASKPKVILACHSIFKDNEMYLLIQKCELHISKFLEMLNIFGKIEILSLACECKLFLYHKQLTFGSRIISLNSNRKYYYIEQFNFNYTKKFCDELYCNGLDFNKIIILYHLNSHRNTDLITQIKDRNTFDMLHELRTVQHLSYKDSPFVNMLLNYKILNINILNTLNDYIQLNDSREFTCRFGY